MYRGGDLRCVLVGMVHWGMFLHSSWPLYPPVPNFRVGSATSVHATSPEKIRQVSRAIEAPVVLVLSLNSASPGQFVRVGNWGGRTDQVVPSCHHAQDSSIQCPTDPGPGRHLSVILRRIFLGRFVRSHFCSRARDLVCITLFRRRPR